MSMDQHHGNCQVFKAGLPLQLSEDPRGLQGSLIITSSVSWDFRQTQPSYSRNNALFVMQTPTREEPRSFLASLWAQLSPIPPVKQCKRVGLAGFRWANSAAEERDTRPGVDSPLRKCPGSSCTKPYRCRFPLSFSVSKSDRARDISELHTGVPGLPEVKFFHCQWLNSG